MWQDSIGDDESEAVDDVENVKVEGSVNEKVSENEVVVKWQVEANYVEWGLAFQMFVVAAVVERMHREIVADVVEVE